MKSETPKQFLELNGKPVLLHTLAAFHRYSPSIPIILVLPGEELGTWNNLAIQHKYTYPLILQTGGETRFQSVRRGLEMIVGNGLVAIHDGVRPLVTEDIINTSFRLAAKKRTAVAAMPLNDSIRITHQDTTRAVDRSKFHLIQTPQTFDLELIRKAYQVDEEPGLSDDASVAERAGNMITLFEGSFQNIKITTAEDLIVAEALLQKRS